MPPRCRSGRINFHERPPKSQGLTASGSAETGELILQLNQLRFGSPSPQRIGLGPTVSTAWLDKAPQMVRQPPELVGSDPLILSSTG